MSKIRATVLPAIRSAGREVASWIKLIGPVRPGMSAEQRIDYKAACDGKITWQQYFAKWGRVDFSP